MCDLFLHRCFVAFWRLQFAGAAATSAGRRQCSSKRTLDRAAKGKGGEGSEEGGRGASRGHKETARRSGSAVTPIPQVTIGLAGPAGGAFNLAKSNSQDFILPKSVSRDTVCLYKSPEASALLGASFCRRPYLCLPRSLLSARIYGRIFYTFVPDCSVQCSTSRFCILTVYAALNQFSVCGSAAAK